MKSIRLSVALLVLSALPLLASPPRSVAPTPPIAVDSSSPPSRLTLAATEGRALDGHMIAFGYTTQSAFAVAIGIPTARISLVHRGLDTLRDAEFDTLTSVLWRTYRASFDTSIDARMRASYLRVFPSSAPPAVNPNPQRGVANGRMNGQTLNTFRLNSLKHGYVDGTRVVLRFTGAAPNIDMHIFYVRVPNVDEVWLYRDSLFTVPVVITTPGMGGTIQRVQ